MEWRRCGGGVGKLYSSPDTGHVLQSEIYGPIFGNFKKVFIYLILKLSRVSVVPKMRGSAARPEHQIERAYFKHITWRRKYINI